MTNGAKLVLCSAVLGTIPLIGGCTVRAHPATVEVEPAPGPVVYDDYYYGGYYEGPRYYWHDRYGHVRWEEREAHERREREEHHRHAEERRR